MKLKDKIFYESTRGIVFHSDRRQLCHITNKKSDTPSIILDLPPFFAEDPMTVIITKN